MLPQITISILQRKAMNSKWLHQAGARGKAQGIPVSSSAIQHTPHDCSNASVGRTPKNWLPTESTRKVNCTYTDVGLYTSRSMIKSHHFSFDALDGMTLSPVRIPYCSCRVGLCSAHHPSACSLVKCFLLKRTRLRYL